MSDEPTKPPGDRPASAVHGGATAPFIYCDGVTSYGLSGGAIQLELGANIVVPTVDGEVRIDTVTTAHLRCNPGAAIALREAIDRALEMVAQVNAGELMQVPVAGRLN